MKINFLYILLILIFISCKNTPKIAPHGPLPSIAQVSWQEMEMNMFIHFNMNTFTNMEWGLGGESPQKFNPSNLDPRQWASIAKAAGMKGIILTAKHHDGFCLWPSAYTAHSVKNSPWKNGEGDVIKDLAAACKEYGLKMGLYLSPWDRNHADYGRPEYIEYFRKQMQEIMTNYGDVFEFWIDGANGGTGYYGGANENRKIDRATYYDWDSSFNLAWSMQKDVVIFSDGGPGCRWVGNEEGWANETNWSLLRKEDVFPGYPNYKELRSGHADGTAWIPAEVDVSIRPGWYYHEYEDHKVKSLPQMLDIYYNSVGRNSLLLLNFPVDKRGLIHPNDSARIMEMANTLNADFALDLAKGMTVTATNIRGNDDNYGPENLLDGDKTTYWSTDDEVTKASVTIEFDSSTTFNRFLIQENISLGQRVEVFSLEAFIEGEWATVDTQTTIGYKRILRLPDIEASAIRFNVLQSRACPVITNLQLFHAPRVLVAPTYSRNVAGQVTLDVPDTRVEVYYTTDGTTPDTSSKPYTGPFPVDVPIILKAVAYDPDTDNTSPVMVQRADIAKKDWKVISIATGDLEEAAKIIDEDPGTWWQSEEGQVPTELIIDLGEYHTISGITYLPIQERWISGFISTYEIFISQDGKDFGKPVATGEFSNILNNPIEQEVSFGALEGRYVKFRAVSVVEGHNTVGFAEVGVITMK